MAACIKRKLLLVLALLVAHAVEAQLPTARLYTIFPAGAKAGSTTEVSVAGIDLDEAATIVFSHSNIVAISKTNETTGLQEAGKFTVVIGTNVSAGAYEARVTGRYGITNPRRFVVGVLPEIIEYGNNALPTAMEPEMTVNGRADSQAFDYFKFSAKKDQRLIAVCEAATIDSKLEPSLHLLDVSGRELHRSRRGGVLDFRVPADGEYVLKLHDFLYGGGADYFYRLTLTKSPYVEYTLPLAGNPGATNTFVLFGRNLPTQTANLAMPLVAPPFSLRPNAATLDGFEHSFSAWNRRFISSTAVPVVREAREPIQRITIPCDLSGQFFPAGDTDVYAFDAKQGDAFWVEIISQRLGLPSDPVVVIKRAKDGQEVQEFGDSDTNLGGAEYKTSSLDPSGKFEAKEDGEYHLHVRDLFSQTDNPANVYRLNIRRNDPDFELLAFPQPPASTKKDVKDAIIWPALVRRGETVPIKVLVLRERGFGEGISLSISGLPAGVSCPGAHIGASQNSATLLLTASESVSNWAGNIVIRSQERSKAARAATVVWNVDDLNREAVRSRLTEELALGICGEESASISIEPIEAKPFLATTGGKAQILLKVTRRGDFKETFKVKAHGVSALESLKEIEITDKTNVVTLELDLAQQKLAAGDYQFYLAGQTKGKHAINPDRAKKLEELAKAAETNKARTDALLALAKEATERAKPKEVTITVYSAPIFLKVAPVQTARVEK